MKFPKTFLANAEHNDNPDTTFIKLGEYVIEFDSLILDPEHDLKNLSEQQRTEMDQEFQAAWKTAVDEILAPFGGEIHLYTSEITAPLKSAGKLTEEILEQIAQVDADPDGELFNKWEAINDAQA